MSRLASLLVLLLLVQGCQAPAADEDPTRPSLVVLVSVDQLRGDLIEIYADAFSHGLARLSREGRVFRNASHRHAATNTAVGHATLATGVIPARHGIVGNDWREWTRDGDFVTVYSVLDTLSPILGYPEAEGRSPRNLQVDGLGDWISAADPDARIVSLANKDRAAIPMAGRGGGHVYWIHDEAGAFVTSVHYRDEYPDWLLRFNRERMPDLLGQPVWDRSTPDSMVSLARRDAFPYEGDGVRTTFPHRRDQERAGALPEAQYRWAVRTPYPDRAVLELAEVIVRELEMGRRQGGTDYLALGFSQTDYVGHDYGPMSQEQLDNLTRLDRVLGDLMDLLDRTVGEGRWVLGLSADHGVMTVPEWSQELGLDSRRLSRDEIGRLHRVAEQAAGAAREAGREVPAAVESAVEQIPWVLEVHTPDEIGGEPADSFAALFARSHSVTRHTGSLAEYGLYLQLESGVLFRTDRQGTGHGSPYWHDRHVPFILLGAEVEPGVSDDPVFTYQMAPSLARLAGVAPPPGLDGNPVGTRSSGNP